MKLPNNPIFKRANPKNWYHIEITHKRYGRNSSAELRRDIEDKLLFNDTTYYAPTSTTTIITVTSAYKAIQIWEKITQKIYAMEYSIDRAHTDAMVNGRKWFSWQEHIVKPINQQQLP